jgi:hypothetical protein
VALRHPDWLASKLIQEVHSPKAKSLAQVSVYTPRRAKNIQTFATE